MTTDDFTTAARAEADRKYGSEVIAIGWKAIFLDAADWARTFLAEQEVPDAEVLAALNAYTGDDDGDIEAWGSYADDMRAALSAARKARS